MDRIDIPVATMNVKRHIMIKAIRCIACSKWECPEYDREKYEAEIIGEALGLCESCRSAIEWAKKMKVQSDGGQFADMPTMQSAT